MFGTTKIRWPEKGETKTDRLENELTNTRRPENGVTNTGRPENGVTNTGPCRCPPSPPPKKILFSNARPAKPPVWKPTPGLDIENLAPAGIDQWPALQPT